MALIQCDFHSDVLGMAMTMNVILPQSTSRQIGMGGCAREGKLPTLYLLHGCSDNHTIWCRRTSVERYAAQYGIAIVMPNAHRSYYTDMKEGFAYWRYISEEVPRLSRRFFPLSDKREENYAAGLSMGGYGAFKLVLRCPEQFCAAASLSGAFGNDWMVRGNPDESRRIFGFDGSFDGTEHDTIEQAKACAASGKPLPKLYQWCGTEDFVYKANVRLKNAMAGLPFDYTCEEGPGVHSWDYWDVQIQRVLKWLPVPKEDGAGAASGAAALSEKAI